MDKASKSYMDSDNLYSSTIPWANEFDYGEEVELSKILDMPQEHHANTSELPNVVPTNTTNISSHSSMDKNSSRISPITLDDDDDYSISYIYSMRLKNEENPKNFIPIPIVMEKQGDQTTNDMILQQPLPKIPIMERLERESSLKSKFTTNHPMRTSTDSCKEQEKNKTNDMSHILILEKLKSHLIKSKLMVGQENGTSSSNVGPIRRSPNRESARYQPFGKEIDQNNQGSSYRIGQNNSESIFKRPQNSNEYMQGWNTQDSHFNNTTNWPLGPFH